MTTKYVLSVSGQTRSLTWQSKIFILNILNIVYSISVLEIKCLPIYCGIIIMYLAGLVSFIIVIVKKFF
jgi:uncharacterized membrane protein YbaN (DUF454 family)